MTLAPPMFVCDRPQTGVPFDSLRVGAKPPSNQPQVTFECVEHRADVRPAHLDHVAGLVGAAVVERVGVAVDGARAGGVRGADNTRVGLHGAGGVHRGPAEGLAGDQVERPRSGRAELGVIEVVAHGEVLGVVPQPGHCVAVEVVHHQAGRGELGGRATRVLGVLHKCVHQSAVQRLLLGGVAMILVAGQRLRGAEPHRVVLVRVIGQQCPRQAVDTGRPRPGHEAAAVGVRGVGVGGEVVVEAHVLLEDHHQVGDRRADVRTRRVRARSCGSHGRGGASQTKPPSRHNRQRSAYGPMHAFLPFGVTVPA